MKPIHLNTLPDCSNSCAFPYGVLGCSEKQDGGTARSMDTMGVMSFLNAAMPPATLSKLFSGSPSMDLTQPDQSLNSNLFGSKPVNGSVALPGIFSSDLHAPGGRLVTPLS